MSGEISLFHLTHHHVVRSFPATIPTLCAVASWIVFDCILSDSDPTDPVEAQVKLNVISPGGEPINTFSRTLKSANRMDQAVFRVMNIPVLREGELVFELIVNDVVVAHHKVVVMLKGPPGIKE
jgi:hypothetical protein